MFYKSLDKLKKFCELERERHYDNRAIVGGLEKILPSWENEARLENVPEEILANILTGLTAYQQWDASQRADWVGQVIILVNGISQQPLNAQRPAPRRPESPVEKPVKTESLIKTIPRPRENPPPRRMPPATLGINAPLTVIQGIGPSQASNLLHLGLRTLGDLLYYFPRRYDDYSRLKPINQIFYGEELTLIGTVLNVTVRPIRGGTNQIVEMVVGDTTGSIRLTWFNQGWISSRYPKDSQVVISGRVDQYLGRLVMKNPEIEALEQTHLHTNRIVPVYPLTARVTQKSLRRMIYQTVNFWAARIPDHLPEQIRSSANLVNLATALSQIHFPDSPSQLAAAQHRLAFDEILLLQLGVLEQKRRWNSVEADIFSAPPDWIDSQLAHLPYGLTDAQRRAFSDICNDFASGKPMNRLIQGDVGSGKTIVAALAAAIIARQDAQSAIMAPTSILAEQHFHTTQRLLASPDLPEAPFKPEEIRLLLGSTPESEREEIRAGLASGAVKLLIGTHALLESPVEFKKLRYVVIDEQHRFGVEQRAILRAKGDNPHLLVMTATPIPRSLALTIYGDLDLSVIDELPPGRQPVATHVLQPIERERAYTLIRSNVKQGNQAFIIYPLIEQGENNETPAAVEEHARLQKEIFPDLKVGLLHGKLKPDEKDAIMADFRDGRYHILVSTSVVEVGVDVPNATVMLVEGANRFGLAQLHQFRGRVGRGSQKSYCLLIPDKEDEVENQRLSVMAETNDGFILAERDLEQRGPGDFLGTRQAGFSELKMSKLTDVKLIEKARYHAHVLHESDPELTNPENQALKEKFKQFWSGGKGDIS
ncbi:MAG TPA: ATP-dependent DNA helicase RecG [Anaerolineaceae bacterium]